MSDDIRDWAIANGIDVSPKGRLSGEVKRAYTEAHPDDESGPGDAETQSSEVRPDVAQTPAEPRSVASKLKRAVEHRQSKPKVKRTGPAKRVSAENVLSVVWTLLAGGVATAGFEGAGYIMTFQAPIAGAILEDAVKGTMVDKLLQPLARGADEVKLLNALLVPPLAAVMMQMNPAWAPKIMVQLRKAMADWLEVAGPKLEIIKERELKFEDKYGSQLDEILSGFLTSMGWGVAGAAGTETQDPS